jgi:hypothetical protein
MNENDTISLIMSRVSIGFMLLLLIGLGVGCTFIGCRIMWQLVTGKII